MPFRSFGELEQFKLIVKDAQARGVLGAAQAFDSNGQPVCAIGHTGAFMGVKPKQDHLTGRFIETRCGEAWGLSCAEIKGITYANDALALAIPDSHKDRVERVCAAADEIGVG